MEILGLVWAASVINQPSSFPNGWAVGAGQPQDHQATTIDGMASWFTSLAQAYGWTTDRSPAAGAFSSYVSPMSWLMPNVGRVKLPQPLTDSEPSVEVAAFSPFLPLAKAALTETNLPISMEADASVSADDGALGNVGQWPRWDAVAAVRIVESAPGPVEDGPSTALSNQCIPSASAPYQASPLAMTAAPKHQIWIHEHFIGEVSGRVAAQAIADKLRALIEKDALDPEQLRPIFGSNFVGGSHHNDVLFVVDDTMQAHPEMPAAAVAVQWINNLRIAFEAPSLDLVQVQMATAGLAETSKELYGTASWYGPGFHGRQTANGERFNENALTAAHKTLPFNTYLKVTNRMNGRSVVVRINDRGPYIGNRSIDLSKAAAQCLGSVGKGVIPYEAVILETVPKPTLDELAVAQVPFAE